MNAAVSITNLTKIYKSKKSSKGKEALKDISLDIQEGSFFGLLGPNGAGKSTLINILAGLVNKTAGKVEICGFNIDVNPRLARKSIGVVPQELVLDPFFPPFETLENTAGYYGVKKSDRRTMEIIKAVGLEDKAFSPARSLSGGMRRRLLVAKALVHAPKVLVLDEPTAGVDVELRSHLWEYVRQLNKQGTTILLTTHYLEEAEELCDYIAIINHGKIIANDSKKNIIKTIDQKKLLITPTQKVSVIPEELVQFSAYINSDGTIEITYNADKTYVEDIIKAFQSTGLTIRDLSTQEPDLEDVFRHLIK